MGITVSIIAVYTLPWENVFELKIRRLMHFKHKKEHFTPKEDLVFIVFLF
jgi:hypothetical protein